MNYDYWRSTPLISKPWFINPGLTLQDIQTHTISIPTRSTQKTLRHLGKKEYFHWVSLRSSAARFATRPAGPVIGLEIIDFYRVCIYIYNHHRFKGGRTQNVSYIFQGVFEGGLENVKLTFWRYFEDPPHKNDTWGTFSDQFYM